MKVEPVILEGKRLRLEPLAESHIIGIAEVIRPEFFKYFGGVTLKSRDPQDLEIYFRARMTGTNTVSFAIISKESEKIVGHSSYMSIREPDRVLEIGATWIGVEYRGTYVNPEAKFLMMRHAFETLGCVRVELKTDERNLLSQNAMTKLGLVREGVMRKHSINSDGYIRNVVYFSVIDDEWPAMKARLLARLASISCY